MLRPGTRVTRLTRRVGQRAPEGKILSVRGDSYEIRWDVLWCRFAGVAM
jgi:hypothetical protein